MSKTVVITGASSGYGKATAKAFKKNGDTVIMVARNFEKLESANNVTRKSQEEKTRRLQDELNAMRQEDAERNDIRIQAARLKRLVESERAETVKAEARYVII